MPLSNQGRLSFFTPLLRSCPRRARRRKGTQTKKDGTDGTDLRMCLPRCRRRQGTSRSPGTARVAGPPAGCGDNSHKLAREERRLHTTMSLPRPPSLPPSHPPTLSPPPPFHSLQKRESCCSALCLGDACKWPGRDAQSAGAGWRPWRPAPAERMAAKSACAGASIYAPCSCVIAVCPVRKQHRTLVPY